MELWRNFGDVPLTTPHMDSAGVVWLATVEGVPSQPNHPFCSDRDHTRVV